MAFTYEEVLERAKEYFSNDDLAAKVFADKYSMRNKEGDPVEITPDAMHKRLAEEFARIDSEKYGFDYQERHDLYYSKMKNFERIVPQGSPMAAIGNKYSVMSASNCVVIPSPGDSMAGIFDTGKALAQLYKRRCVEENTLITTLEKGLLPIKDVSVGMHVLSFDIKEKKSVYKRVLNKFATEVIPEDRVELVFDSGARLKTSRKHPVLIFENGEYLYRNAGDILLNDVGIRPEKRTMKDEDLDTKMLDIGWLIGAHMGDGSTDNYKIPRKEGFSHRVRFRILGDNEEIVSKYRDIFNSLSGSKANYNVSGRKDYRTRCWEYTNCNQNNNNIVEEYFDNQIGSKTYSGFTPSFVKDNFLWWPYLGGLIDTDGHIKNGGESISLRICAKDIIDELAVFLSGQGISCRTSIIPPRRSNEATQYELYIHGDTDLWRHLAKYVFHPEKKKFLLTKKVRHFSHTKPISEEEFYQIEKVYIKNPSPKLGNFAACMSLLRRRADKRIDLGGLAEFASKGVITEGKKNEILQRTCVRDIISDEQSDRYYDIEVEDTNNFYAGNFGLVNIHNCGVGISLETLRPEGTPVNNAARTTSGAWSFADFFSYITRMVGQNSRRGALMLTMDVHHPDILSFITMKHDLTKVTGANISVKLSDEFLKAVENDEEYEQRWPCVGKAKIKKNVRAKDIWDAIVSSATTTAEPGLLFWNNIQDGLPADKYPGFKSISTNPCSEIPLSNDSCRLISHNLTGYVRNAFKEDAKFDYAAFKEDIQIAMQMIDNLVDIEIELIDKIIDTCDTEHEKGVWQHLQEYGKRGRRTGLGTHGLADTLAQLRIRYDSDEGLEEIDKIYRTLRDTAYQASIDLAKVRGPFPDWNWEHDKKSDFIKRLPKKIKDQLREHGRRNISILTQAPTGSISILSKCGEFNSHNISSGVEPVFRNSYVRRKKINSKDEHARVDYVDALGDAWQEFKVYHGNVKNYMDMYGLESEDDLPDFFVTSDQIDWKKRVELQAVEQQYIDHAISSTINLPAGTSEEAVGEIYLHAWKNKLKGITVYVEGSRDGVLITESSTQNADVNGRPTQIVHTEAPKRPDALPCEIHHVTVKGTPWTVLLGMMGEDPYEIFAGHSENLTLPKKYQLGRIVKENKGQYNLHVDTGDEEELVVKNVVKTFDNPEHSWATRMISTSLRHGCSVEFLVDQLSKDGGIGDINKVFSRIFKKFIKNGAKVKVSKVCLECGSDSLIYVEGCESCTNCGHSKCG